MACRTARLDNGTKVWLCDDLFNDSQVCAVCGDIADVLCDFPIGSEKTCDMALCRYHSTSIRGDIDYCPYHSTEYGEIITLQSMEKELVMTTPALEELIRDNKWRPIEGLRPLPDDRLARVCEVLLADASPETIEKAEAIARGNV